MPIELLNDIKKRGLIMADIYAFDVQNIHDYRVGLEKTGYADIYEFQSVKLPFEHTWFEFKTESGKRVGFYCRDIGNKINVVAYDSGHGGCGILSADVAVNADYTLTDLGGGRTGLLNVTWHDDILNLMWRSGSVKGADKLKHQIAGLFLNVLYALNFLACKNVKQNIINQSSNRATRRQYGVAFTEKYHVLTISKISKNSSCDVGYGLPKSLHICRGHFREYKDKPLFGKYYGRFWVPSHTKGNPETGIITKDYKVNAR